MLVWTQGGLAKSVLCSLTQKKNYNVRRSIDDNVTFTAIHKGQQAEFGPTLQPFISSFDFILPRRPKQPTVGH